MKGHGSAPALPGLGGGAASVVSDLVARASVADLLEAVAARGKEESAAVQIQLAGNPVDDAGAVTDAQAVPTARGGAEVARVKRPRYVWTLTPKGRALGRKTPRARMGRINWEAGRKP